MATLLVGSLNYALDGVGRGESPENEGSKKGEL